MLINCTNHPYEILNTSQRDAANRLYGEVADLPFPQVDPTLDSGGIRRMVTEYAAMIEEKKPDAVLAAGEFTFLFMLVDRLLRDGIQVVCTCSRRDTVEAIKPDGTVEKKSVFSFEGFRAYEFYGEHHESPQ